jgi:phage N-6-adenine-methyltransferase
VNAPIAQLTAYNMARTALAKARTVDEVKKIKFEADRMRAYARISKDKKLMIDAEEIRARAVREIGKMKNAQSELLAKVGRPKNGSPSDPFSKLPTLAEIGIDKHLADRARKLAAFSDGEFEEKVDDWRETEMANEGFVTGDLLKPHVHRALGTGDNEWYTPREHVDIARKVLGTIDLDPASSAIAQRTVKATTYFTKNNDGLTKKWRGKVWLNPPYSQPDIADFVAKLLSEIKAGHVTEAILLTHNFSDTKWFHAAANAARLLCFTEGRIRFVDPDGNVSAAPTNGQTFFYFGNRPAAFAAQFCEIGFVAERCGGIERPHATVLSAQFQKVRHNKEETS